MVRYFLYSEWTNGRRTRTVSTDEKYATLAVEQALVEQGISVGFDDYYLLHQGKRVCEDDEIVDEGWYHAVPRLIGGKGGFGSMLRALGAQIEKTTNREACRDLSGRRMRDVNNEKKLREWAAKSADREKEKQERRRLKRERVLAPKKFKEEDKGYELQRQKIADDLDDAFKQGMKKSAAGAASSSAACSSSSASASSCSTSSKRKSPPAATEVDPKKAKPWINMDDEDSGSGDESETAELAHDEADKNPDEVSDKMVDEAVVPPSGLPSDLSTEEPEKSTERSDDKNPQTDPVIPVQLGQSLDLEDYDSAKALSLLGLDALKAALMARGMKCGGTIEERADRLFSVKGIEQDKIPSNLLAKPTKKK